MKHQHRLVFGCFLRLCWMLILSTLAVQVPAQQALLLEDQQLINALQGGGFNLYFRHEATDWSQDDAVNQAGDWLSCDGQRMRQLSRQGRENAVATGKAIRALGIPVSKVLASPYCRTVETARLLGLGKVAATEDVINLRVSDYFGGTAAVVKSAQALLARVPAPGSNLVIVAHGNVAREATPVYPDEGEGVVFEPDGAGGFRVVGRLTAAAWRRLSPATD